MSYAINITGHQVTETDEESQNLEKEVLEKVDEFVQTLPGVNNATVSGAHIGMHHLVGEPTDEN